MGKKSRRIIAVMLVFSLLISMAVPSVGHKAKASETTYEIGCLAEISTDFVSSWENLSGVINAEFEPTSSAMGTGKGWGNWFQEAGSEHYIELAWPVAVTTSSFDLYWYDDGGGTRIPGSVRFSYQDNNGAWQDAVMLSDYDSIININTYNRINIESVTTKAIRMYNTVHENGAANGVYRWKVYSEEIPEGLATPGPKPTDEPADPDLSLKDAAVYAEPASDYTSPWENINGINNPDFNPTSSSMGQTGLGWGDWSQPGGSEHWLQYTWTKAIDLRAFQVYWYGDSGGIQMPQSIRFEYMDDMGSWQPANMISSNDLILKESKYNQIIIDKVKTKSIRMYMTVRPAAQGVGVYRWKVHSDVPESFEVESALAKVTIPEVHNNIVTGTCRNKLTLADITPGGEASITWKSSNEAVIAQDGTVTYPDTDTTVTLTATCTKGDISVDKTYTLTVLANGKTGYQITVDTDDKGVDISKELFGLFYEDINCAGDGGLSAELIKNNSFENYDNVNSPTAPEVKGNESSWKRHWDTANAGGFFIERTEGINDNNTNYARLTGNITLYNGGFGTKNAPNAPSIPVEDNGTYDFTIYAKAPAAYSGNVSVKLLNGSGIVISDELTLELIKDGAWHKLSGKLTGTAKEAGKLAVTVTGAGSDDSLYIDMVSLHSTDTYGYGNKNYAYGAGIRKDLVQMLMDLKPSFIRFPGGCIV